MKRLLVLFALTLLCCDPPPVSAGADKRQNTHNGRIEGHVVVSSVARGDVVLFLFDAARPPPPVGTGRPLTFAVVSQQTVFGAAPDGNLGPFTAPFAFSLVAPGRYLIRGFVDANHDFIPWYGVTAEVNTGDVGGGAVDPLTRAARVIEVTVDDAQLPVATLDVPVSISDTARVPTDRPVFSMPGPVTLGTGASVLLSAQPISSGAVQQASPVFLARFVDDDGDGMPDDANRDGVPDFWPRVIVRKLSDKSVLLDENDLDKNGVLDTEPPFADYDADGNPDLVVLAAGFDVTALAPSLLDANGRVKLTPTPVTSLRLVIQARALDVSNPAAPKLIKTVPKGRYAITVIQTATGQTWRVPNELSLDLAESRGLPPVESQGFVVEVLQL